MEDPTKVARRRRKRLVRQVAWLFLAAVLVAALAASIIIVGPASYME